MWKVNNIKLVHFMRGLAVHGWVGSRKTEVKISMSEGLVSVFPVLLAKLLCWQNVLRNVLSYTIDHRTCVLLW